MKDKNTKELLQELAGDPAAEYYAKSCKVLEVDEATRTCDVEPYDGTAAVYNVRLQATESGEKGLVLIPVVGSGVLVVFISKSRAFVALSEEVDKIVLVCKDMGVDSDLITYNGGEFGGWFKAPKVNDELNKMKDRMAQLEIALTTFASSQASAAATSPLTPLAAAPAALGVSIAALPPNGTFNGQLIDDKIKH